MSEDKTGGGVWDKISALYYTHTLGTTSKAGIKLGISHSTISKYIRRLEEIMEEPLAHLEGKNLILTKKGQEIVDVYQNLILQHERTFERLKRSPDKMQGHFTLSLSPLLSHAGFFEEIAPFCEIHSSLSFSFHITDDIPNLAAGESDIDIRPLTSTEEFNDYRYLTTYDMGLYASRAYIQKKGLLERFSDVKDHDCVALSKSQLFPYSSPDWQALPSSDWHKFIVIDSYKEVFQAIENGMGIGVLPHTAIKLSRVPLIPILHDSLSQSLDIYYHSLKSMDHHKVIQELYTYLIDQPEGPLKGRRRRKR